MDSLSSNHNADSLFAVVRRALLGTQPLTQTEHDALLEMDRTTYASLLQIPGLQDEDTMGIIIRLLAVTEGKDGQRVSPRQRRLEDALIQKAIVLLPEKAVLDGFLQIVERRVNNQRTAGWIRSYFLGSPSLERWAVTYRASLARLLRHAMGKRVSQTCLHFLAKEPKEARISSYLHRHLLRYAADKALAQEVFPFLYGKLTEAKAPLLRAYLEARTSIEAGAGLPLRTLQGIAGTFHKGVSMRQLRRMAGRNKRKREIDLEQDAQDTSLIGLIRRFYKENRSQELFSLIDTRLSQLAAQLPAWDAHVVAILDASDSMRGFGFRQYNNIAIGAAFCELLKRRTSRFSLLTVGGEPVKDDFLPQPAGATALAPALLEAASQKPDAILVISDGYENAGQGDCAALIEGFRQLGLDTPILHIMPVFTMREVRKGREPFGDAPVLLETAERGMLPLWLRVRSVLEPKNMQHLLAQVVSLA